MNPNQSPSITVRERVGWIILLGLSLVLLVHSAFWLFTGANTMMAEIVERTDLTPPDFQTGSSPTIGVLSIVNGNYAVFEAALALMGAFLSWRGQRRAGRDNWRLMGVFVLALIGVATNFGLVAGIYAATIGYLTLAAIGAIAWLLARPPAAEPLAA